MNCKSASPSDAEVEPSAIQPVIKQSDVVDPTKRLQSTDTKPRRLLSRQPAFKCKHESTLERNKDRSTLQLRPTKRAIRVDYLRPDYRSRIRVVNREEPHLDISQSKSLAAFHSQLDNEINSSLRLCIESTACAEEKHEKVRSEQHQVPCRPPCVSISSEFYELPKDLSFGLSDDEDSKDSL